MERRYNVVPILAVIVAEEDIDNGAVISILMPFAGLSLESLSMPASDSGASHLVSYTANLGLKRKEIYIQIFQNNIRIKYPGIESKLPRISG